MENDFEILHAILPIVFTDKNNNNRPLLFQHQSEDPARNGLPITDLELMDFAIKILADLYTEQGLKVKSKNRIQNNEYPNLVLEVNGQQFFLAIKIARYPINPLQIPPDDYGALKDLAHEAGAIPLFAPLSFGCATNAKSCDDLANTIYGGVYYVAYRSAFRL